MRFTDLSVSMIAVWALQLSTAIAEDRGRWDVEIYKDDLCEDSTGIYSDKVSSECESFDGMPEILSIRAEAETLGARCGFTIYAYEDYHCKGEQWSLRDKDCLRANLGDTAPLKSFKVGENPCVSGMGDRTGYRGM
ncbi:hypothetical protein N7519_002638 [Penicillium mononematosum]|uniref:uncharacterized protein n=1 Tax=Penicillium mononematosum TaxID=268346 RepID=UPI002546CA58|nr:uncharacterized protein N7519_002638 [Penicillium mononematosum]KAJ6187730.1 hypothetical protein N7519_002638 [Penicillium mononematosum]